MNRVVFLDTAYAIALSAPADQLHESAVRLAARIEAEGVSLVTTRAVAVEIGNAVPKLKDRRAAVELLASLDDDPSVEVVPLSEELYAQAYQLYAGRADKEWGLTDCLSFVVMRERGLTEALTADEHVRQAGFGALLREP